MAEASFTIRAVDATRQAFADINNSLTRIGKVAREVGNITKVAFGAGAIMRGLQTLDAKLNKVAASGDEMGFSDEQIANAIRMEQLIEGITNFLIKLPLLFAKLGVDMGGAFITGMRPVEDIIKEFRDKLNKSKIEGLDEQLKSVNQEIENSRKTAGRLADEYERSAEILMEQSRAARDTAEGKKLELQAQEKLLAARRIEVDLQRDFNDARAKFTAAKDPLLQAGRTATLTLEESKKRAYSLGLAISQNIDAVTKMEMAGVNAASSYERVIEQVQEYESLTQKIAKLEAERMKFSQDAADILANGFEDAILSGNKLSEVLRNLGQDLLRLVFRNLITAPLAGTISGIIGGVLGVGARAMGGPVSANSPYVVGERGPELFVPGTSGTIIPNDSMRGTAAAVGPNINISYNIQSGVSRAELQPILEGERKRLRAEIPDMVRRGGSYRAAFA